jgi:hypothetical protein
VSIVCPAEDREVLLTWARAAGWRVYYYPAASCSSSSAASSSSSDSTCVASEGDAGEEEEGEGEEGDGGTESGGERAVIGVPLLRPGLGTEVWGFRVRTVGEGAWEWLWRVRPAEMVLASRCVGLAGQEGVRTRALVVAVPSLVDEFARAWYFCVVKGGGDGAQERYIAGLILWGLQVVAGDVEWWRLKPEHVPCFVYSDFLDMFLDMYPEARKLLRLCGLHDLWV